MTTPHTPNHAFDPYDALSCQHLGGGIDVVISPSTGSWTATCQHCGDTWRRISKNIPDAVMTAVYDAAGVTHMDVDEARALGLYVAAVGDPYLPPSPLKQGLRWIITSDGVECGVYYDELTPELIDVFHVERSEFALVAGDHALMLSLRFGRDFGWFDGSWQAALQPSEVPAGIAEPESGLHLPVKLILVNSADGTIAAMRIVTWPYRFHQAVYKAVRSQLDHESGVDDGMREVAYWVERYPDPNLLVAKRAEIICRGGAATAFPR